VVPALWLASLTVNYPIKAIFRRARPFDKHEHVIVVGARPTDPSFPSGHTATAFAGAMLMSLRHPEWAPVFYTFAALVGFSRVYLGVHFPFDVAMGSLAGTMLALLWGAVLGAIAPILAP
jgi:undecaprenyl-diphosphatase